MTTPRRSAPATPRRSLALVVLSVGSVLAVVAALGPAWSARAGVVLALTLAVVSNVLAWREVRAQRQEHAKALLRLSQVHGVALREERRHNQSVVSTLTTRVADAAATIERQQLTIGELHVAVATLEGRTIRMRGEARRRDAAVATLRQEVANREAELEALRAAAEAAAAEGARIHSLPRRTRHLEPASDAPAEPTVVTEAEVWTDRRPSVAELTNAELAVSLPNFETDRRWA